MAASRSVLRLEALEDRQLLSTGLQLRLEQPGFNPLVVNDNGPGDVNPQDGVIVFVGAYGTFPSNVITGVRTPNGLALNTSNQSSSGGALDVILGDTGFVPDGPAMFRSAAGGILSGSPGSSVTAQSWVNPDNAVAAAGDTAGEIVHDGRSVVGSGSAEAVVDHTGAVCAIVSRAQIVLNGPGFVGYGMVTDMEVDSGLIGALVDEED